MNEATIKAMLQEAIENLYKNQPNIFKFTSVTGQTEWNLAHHLSTEIHKLFPWFDHDLDVTKTSYRNKRPDIILHKRGTHKFNFLVIETKRDGEPWEIKVDREKIEAHWFEPELSYQFGSLINLRRNMTYEVEVFRNPKRRMRSPA